MWTPVANMNGRRLQFGVAVLDDKLYVVGGRDGLKTLNTVECYNPKTKTWSVMPPMSTHRHGLGKCVCSPAWKPCIRMPHVVPFCTRREACVWAQSASVPKHPSSLRGRNQNTSTYINGAHTRESMPL